MSPQHLPEEALTDILAASEQAMQFVQGMSYADFRSDVKTQYAVVRALEIIGEATRRLPMIFRERHREAPWRDMAGMRDKLIHGYTVVDYNVVWKTVIEDLPQLSETIHRLLIELQDG